MKYSLLKYQDLAVPIINRSTRPAVDIESASLALNEEVVRK